MRRNIFPSINKHQSNKTCNCKSNSIIYWVISHVQHANYISIHKWENLASAQLSFEENFNRMSLRNASETSGLVQFGLRGQEKALATIKEMNCESNRRKRNLHFVRMENNDEANNQNFLVLHLRISFMLPFRFNSIHVIWFARQTYNCVHMNRERRCTIYWRN